MKTTITRHKHVICPLCQGAGTITTYVEPAPQTTTTTITIPRERIINRCIACGGKGILVEVEIQETENVPTINLPFSQPYQSPNINQPWNPPHITWCTDHAKPTSFPFDVFCDTTAGPGLQKSGNEINLTGCMGNSGTISCSK